MRKTQLKGVLMLLITAMIWGAAFVAQSVGMESVGAFTFSAVRMFMAVCVLLPVVRVRDKRIMRVLPPEKQELFQKRNRNTLRYGAILGVVLFTAANLQQMAFNYAASGKIAFITALYIFFVPLLSLFLGKRMPLLTWVSVGMACAGMYFLCVNPQEPGKINTGDLLTLGSAVMNAIHILLIEKYVAETDGVKLSCVQFAVAGSISAVVMFAFEKPTLAAIGDAIVPLLYAGVLSCGLAYTLQIIGQRYTDSTVASLLMCLESVFGALFGALLLGERLSGREILGCAVMFAAILLSQTAPVLTERLRKLRRS